MKNRTNIYAQTDTHSIRIFLLLITAILLFYLSNPNMLFTKGIGFLGWFIYIPVLLLIQKTSIKTVGIYGFLYGAAVYALCGYWLIDYHPFALLAVIFSYAVILSVVFVLLKLCNKIFENNGWILQWAVLCLYEYVKTIGFLGFNYGVTAYTQWKYPVIIQICYVTGVFGLNALIIFNSTTIYAYIQKKIDRKIVINQLLIGQEKHNVKSHINYSVQKQEILKSTSIRNPLIGFVIQFVLLILVFVYGFVSLHKDEFKNNETITVAAIQNNDVSSKTTVDDYRVNVRNLISLSNEAIEYNPEIKIVVWPETAVVPAIVYHYEEKKDVMRYTIVKSVLDYINLHDATFIVGNGHYGELEGNLHKKYNSALVFEGGKNTIPPKPEIYVKQHLVPFSEYFPLEKRFPKFADFLLKENQSFWIPGKENVIFHSRGLAFSTLICFEDTFTDIARKMYLDGSRCFFNLSNDSWSQSKACQNQHLAMAVFRSVENKVPSVRSAASGETCIINQNGKIIAHAPAFCLSYAISKIPIISESSEPGFYTKHGDFCGWGFVLVILIMLLIKLIIVIIDAIKLRLKYR